MLYSNTDRQIDHKALTAELQAHGYHLLLPLTDGKTQPLAPSGWIRRDGRTVTYGDHDRTYHADSGVVR